MKKLMLMLIVFVVFSPLVAQKTAETSDKQTQPYSKSWLGNFEQRQSRFVQMLNLSETQRRSLDTVNDAYVVQRATLFDEKGMNRRDRKQEIRELYSDRETKFRNLLTEEQLNKWEEFKKRQKRKVLPKK